MLRKQNDIGQKIFFQNSRYLPNDYFIFHLLHLIRFGNCLTASFALFAGSILAGAMLNIKIIHGMFTAFFLTAASNVLNDLIDLKIDQINRPNRPLVNKKISEQFAKLLVILFYFSGFLLTLFWELKFILMYLILVFLSLWYNFVGKKLPLIGNITVALFGAAVPLMGAMIGGDTRSGIVAALLVFFIFIAREITKDIEDNEGDTAQNIKTIVHYMALDKIKVILISLNVLTLVVLSSLFVQDFSARNFVSFSLFSLIVIILITISIKVFKIKNYDKIVWHANSNYYKSILIIGIFTLLSIHYQL